LIFFAFRLLASTSPSSKPLENSSGIFFNSSPYPPKPSSNPAAAFPAAVPASLAAEMSLEGPMRKREVTRMMAISGSPKPKNE